MRKLILVLALTGLSACAEKGDRGATGPAGQPGVGCTVAQLSNGAQIECGDTAAFISNGSDGQDAVLPPGYSYIPEGAFYIAGIEDLCGNGAQEVLFRLSDNRLVAHYSHGSKQYLAVLSPGNYITTDGYSCNFSVGPAPTYTISY